MYDHDLEGLLVVLAIRCCVNATEATMQTASSVEEDGCDVYTCVGCKAEGKSTAVTSQDCLSLLTLTAVLTLVRANVDGYFH